MVHVPSFYMLASLQAVADFTTFASIPAFPSVPAFAGVPAVWRRRSCYCFHSTAVAVACVPAVVGSRAIDVILAVADCWHHCCCPSGLSATI
jgi:hypothetical protein